MKAFVVGAHIAAGGGREARLAVHGNTRAVSVAIAARSPKQNRKPVISAIIAVEKQHGRSTENADHDVHLAIIIDVSKGGTARGQRRGYPRIGALEMAVVIHRQQWQFFIAQRSVNLLNIVQHVALRNEQIFPTIIVKIFQSRAPAELPDVSAPRPVSRLA